MDEPWNWFRAAFERAPTELEALSFKPFQDGKARTYKCTLLDRECRYDPRVGSGDCRRCSFALVHMMENHGWKKASE